nr:type I-E CRISPR-associated protein Cas7/Cse4/CasC [Methylobacterium nodulans]
MTNHSSQCLKRHWRIADDEHALSTLGVPNAVRSKEIVDREIGERLAAKGIAPEVVKAVADEFAKALYGKNAVDPKKRQALVLGWPEVRYLADAAERVAGSASDAKAADAAAKEFFAKGDGKANLTALRDQGRVPFGLEVALFGRMVTSDPAANKDAAIHVAHAFTVHDEELEQDYFTVVDDLKQLDEDEDAGAAGVFNTELTSGLYYGHVVVDVPQLVMNLEGVDRTAWLAAGTDRGLAGRVVENLIHLIAKVSPGAKRGSTAPYAHAEFVLVEMGQRQPRTLANAFRTAVPLKGANSLLSVSSRSIAAFLDDMDEMYGPHETRLLAARREGRLDGVETIALPEIARRVNTAITAGQV